MISLKIRVIALPGLAKIPAKEGGVRLQALHHISKLPSAQTVLPNSARKYCVDVFAQCLYSLFGKTPSAQTWRKRCINYTGVVQTLLKHCIKIA
jgi:hypothetical protein